MSITFKPKPKNYSKTLATRKTFPTYFRVGIVKPHGYFNMPRVAVFSTQDLDTLDKFIQGIESSDLHGGWLTPGEVVALKDYVPPYVGGPPLLIHGKSESQASIRRRLG